MLHSNGGRGRWQGRRSWPGWLSAAAVSCTMLFGCRDFGLIAVVDDRSPDAGFMPSDAGRVVVDAAPPSVPPLVEGADASEPAADQPSGAAGVCGSSRAIEVCDPIKDTGCSPELGMQCDVDLQASVLQGQCVFKAPQTDGGTCLNIPPTESCPPGQTCVDFGECRTVCLCNSDCDPGDCCTMPLGELGFRTCRPCG